MKAEAYVEANKMENSRGFDKWMELPSDEPLSVDGTVLDPVPAQAVRLRYVNWPCERTDRACR